VVVKSDPIPLVDPAPILVTGDPVIATQIEPIRVETRQPAAEGIPIQESAKRQPIRSEDAIRFDLALDELDAISPAKTGARARLLKNAPFADEVAAKADMPRVVARDVAFDDGLAGRSRDAARNDEGLFELLATDRIASKPAARLDAAVDARPFARRRL
jgi:hypothetical protein